MKNANDRGQELPEFTPEYIDQLFSGTISKPKPEKTPEPAPPAEKKAQIFTAAKAVAMQETDTEEYEPEPQKSWRKPVLIVAAAVVLFFTLSLIIPNAIANAKANANSDQWQARCEETYVELISRETYHYTQQDTYRTNVYYSESWQHGRQKLTIHDRASGEKYIELLVNQIRFTTLIGFDGSSSKWSHSFYPSWGKGDIPETLGVGEYILDSIHGSLSGTEVTFKKDLRGSADRLIFHFDAGGNFTALSETGNLEMENYTRLYTFLSTSDEEILATILKYHEDATQ